MAEKDTDATQLGADAGAVTTEVVDTAAQLAAQTAAAPKKTDRELETERIAAARTEKFNKEHGITEPVVEIPALKSEEERSAAASATDLSLIAQLGKQLEDGTFVLNDDALARVMVRTKVDGKEELVPAGKALGQYQKNGAADARLAEASRKVTEANEVLAAANAARAAPVETKKDDAAVTKAADELKQLHEAAAQSLYEGDIEKAAQINAQIMEKTLAGRSQPAATPVDINSVVDQAVEKALPAMKQRLTVESALDRTLTDYPQFRDDPDLNLAVNHRIATLEAQGISRVDAISEATGALVTKYGLVKAGTSDAPKGLDPTTRDQKLAAKKGLDEPEAAAARAVTTVAVPQTNSQIIAQMAKDRMPQAA